MKINLLIAAPLSLLCLLSTAAMAQDPATPATTTTAAPTAPAKPMAKKIAPAAGTSAVAAPKKEEAPSVKYSMVLGAEYDLQAQTQPDGSRSQEIDYEFKPGIAYGNYSAFIDEYLAHDLVDSSATSTWSDPVIGVGRKGWELGPYVKLAPSASVQLPLKDSTKNEVGLLYSVAGFLGFSLNTKNMGLDSWSFGYQIGAYRNFTKFDTNAKTGNPNMDHKFRQRFTLGYDITDKLSFFNLFDFSSKYSVNGVVTNNFFLLNTLGYQLTDNFSVSILHTNDGGGVFLKGDNYENNLKVYDSTSSIFGVAVELDL
jgi:hypothetical protein